jgi:signal transduction histidine kinase
MDAVTPDGFTVRWRRTIVWAFSIIATGFLAETFVSQWLASSIDAAANQIVTDFAPSVVSLAETRAELHRLQDYAVDYVEGKAVPANRTQVAAATGAVTRAMERYESLPFIPGERELWEKVKVDVEAVHRALSLTLAATDRGDRALAQRLAREDLRDAVDVASNDILANIELNGSAADEAGRLIARRRRESMWAAAVLDVISIVLTAVMATLIYRLSAQYNALQRRQAGILREANAELELFANRLSHDIVSPLASTRLSIDAALKTSPSPEARRMLERGIGGIERATHIAHGLLEFARAGAHPRPNERADVRAVVFGVVDELRPLADKTGARLDASVPDGTAVACDEGLLASAVSNLVRNAINYLDGAGEKRVDVTVENTGPRIKIDVRDTGPGLPPGAEAKLFEPYVRGPDVKRPGLGLGLATVKRIVETHGGAVGVESHAGAGARFWIELPRAPGAG